MQTFSDSASLSSQAILRLDEMRELLINLSQTTNAKAYTRLANTICAGVQESITALQSKLISPPQSTNETQNGATQSANNGITATQSETDTTTSGVAPIESPTTPTGESTQTDDNPTTTSTQSTLENRLIAKMIELYTIIYDKLTNAEANQLIGLQILQSIPTSNDIESLASKNDLTNLATSSQFTLVEQMLQTIISTLSTQSGTTSGGLSDLQDSKLTNINTKTMETNEIANILYQQVGVDTETNTTVHTKLSSIESKTDAIIATLNIAPPQPPSPTPFEPSPNVVYKTRDTITSEFSYTINTPTSTYPEYFTINDGISAMCKVEFDISCDVELPNINLKLMLSESSTLYDNEINISASNNHYCITGIFITERTDYYLQLIFDNQTNISFTVSNIEFEVVGNNANFLYYEHKWDIMVLNYNYYIYNKTIGMKYLITSAITPNLGADYTIIANDTAYIYHPFMVTAIINSVSTLKALRFIRLNKETQNAEFLSDTGTYLASADNSNSRKCNLICHMHTNQSSTATAMWRYNSKTKKLFIFSANSNYNKLSNNTSTTISDTIPTYVKITPIRDTMSYKNYYLYYPQNIKTCCNGLNYACYNLNFNQSSCLGYGTKVSAGTIPNYLGTNQTDNYTIKTIRAFLYQYDHWQVVYYKYNDTNFSFLGTKTLEGDYDEVLPGFNGDFFVVQDGQLIRMTDPDVVPESIVT